MSYVQKRFSKIKQDCAVCRVEFDNWISNNHYDLEQEKVVREHFCKYCPFCIDCDERVKGRLQNN